MLLNVCQNIQNSQEYSDIFPSKTSQFVAKTKKSISVPLHGSQSLSTSSQGLLSSFKYILFVRCEDMLS